MVYIIENEVKETESGTEFFAKYDNSYLEQYNDLFLLMYTYLHRHKSIEGYVNLTIKDFLLYHNYTPNRTKGRINNKIYDTLNLMIKRGFIQYIGCYSNGGLSLLENVDCDMMFTVQIINYDTNWNPENRFTKILYLIYLGLKMELCKLAGEEFYCTSSDMARAFGISDAEMSECIKEARQELAESGEDPDDYFREVKATRFMV